MIKTENIKKFILSTVNITRYSVKMFFRDKTAIFFSLFIPVLIMSIFGLLNLGGSIKFKVGVVDESHTTLSAGFTETLKKVDGLEISEGERDTEINKLKESDLNLVLVIPKDFALPVTGNYQKKPEIKTYFNATEDQTNTAVVYTIIEKVVDGMGHNITKTPELYTISKESVSVTSKELKYVNFIIPGVLAMSVMQMSIFGVVGAIVSWRERGILRRLLATPVKPGSILFGQVFTRLLISVSQVALLIALGVLFFNLEVVGSYFLIFLLAVFGGIIFLSMGFAMSGVGSQNTVMALSNLIVMPQMFLSGVFFPRELMPDWLGSITSYFPLTYLADAMREVINNGANIMAIRTDLIGLAVWGVIAFAVSTKLFRWE